MRTRGERSRLLLGAALLLAACDNTTGLPVANIANVVDTISLYALDGTSLPLPSGYVITSKTVVRTDQRSDFDFAFNITPAGQAVLLPTGAVGLGVSSGIDTLNVPFDAVKTAPTTKYIDSLPVAVDSGAVLVAHSRPVTCSFGAIVFYYGKIEILAVDTIARRIDLRVLVDQNCGYRDLEPGIPRR
jgi:hypothetical protein